MPREVKQEIKEDKEKINNSIELGEKQLDCEGCLNSAADGADGENGVLAAELDTLLVLVGALGA